jgi:hypothetical protein
MPRTVVPGALAPAAGGAAAGGAGPTSDGLPEALVKYVPAETLAFFVPVSAAIGTGQEAGLIAVMIVAALGSLLYLWVQAPKPPAAPKFYFYLLAELALACWMLGTSGAVQDLVGVGQTAGGVVLLSGTFLIPLADRALEKLGL